MKTCARIMLCVVFLVAVAGVPALQAALVVAGAASADFKEYPANLRKEAFFTLANNGTSPAKITAVQGTCGCAEATVAKRELAPGETTELKAAILPESIFGNYSKAVFVRTDAKDQPVLVLMLNGNARPLLDVHPSGIVYAGVLTAGGAWKQSFRIKPQQAGVTFGVPVTDCNYPAAIEVKPEIGGSVLVTATVDLAEAKGDLRLAVRVPVEQPAGWKAAEMKATGKVAPAKK